MRELAELCGQGLLMVLCRPWAGDALPHTPDPGGDGVAKAVGRLREQWAALVTDSATAVQAGPAPGDDDVLTLKVAPVWRRMALPRVAPFAPPESVL